MCGWKRVHSNPPSCTTLLGAQTPPAATEVVTFDALPDDLRGRVRVVVSNPPYVRDDDPHLREGDVRFEPRMALVAGPDGLEALRTIIAAAPAHLAPSGWLIVEHGYDQGAAVRALMQSAGMIDIASVRDLAGHERVSLARSPR